MRFTPQAEERFRIGPLLGAMCVTALLTLGASGCSPAAPSEGRSNENIDETTSTVSPEDWVPHERIAHRTYTDAELDDYRESYLSARAEQLTTPPPEVELVRWTTTLADDASAQAECLTEAGFPAEPSADGSLTFTPSVPGSQDDALNLALYVCAAKYTPVPALTTDWTPEQIGMAWDYWNEAFIPCLESRGLPVPDEEIPTRQTYIDTFYEGNSRWMPSAWITDYGDDAQAVAEACPPLPPHEYFYGG